MIHTVIGSLGHLLVVGAFVASLVSIVSYFTAVQKNEALEKTSWSEFGRRAFQVHALFVIGIVTVLYSIINQGFFEYHYAYSHSSSILPFYYQISAFWEGQEGSFLLWIFWNAILGLILIQTNKFWEGPVMTIFALVQAFLLSMIIGVVPWGDFKIGSSPFMLLRDVMNAPIFKTNPNFIPEDGSGLNPLLQNYWMVIHPPTLFLGFSTTLIPFAYCIGGLWVGKFKEWIRPALPWTLFSGVVLGVGILMGAYWAYETLNFGGYWNWDPVENAVYVPWLILIAAIHTMIAYKKSTAALKSAVILSVSAFLLIVYSTFLTRSGILGDSSVHSFTDLGLSGQLLIYLLVFVIGSAVIISSSWKHLGSDENEVSTYSREFWIFMGATVLCLMGFQVIIPTSIPVWNTIMDNFGIDSNLAPPVDQVEFYTKFQIWGGVLIAILSGTGQFFWWNKMDQSKLKDALLGPVIVTLVLTTIIMLVMGIRDISYIILLTTGLYAIVANGKILIDRFRTNVKLAGGAMAHIGIAMMLVGILFSSGYSKILSLNNTGLVWSSNFPDEVNQKNLLLFQNEPRQMGDFKLHYRGMRKKSKGFPGYINLNDLLAISETKAIALEDIYSEERRYFKKGDTLELMGPENSYFEIDYTRQNGKTFTLYPKVQINEKMDMTVYSPDIDRRLGFDMYTHIRTFPDPKEEADWGETKEINVKIGEPFFANDYVATLDSVERIFEVEGVNLSNLDVAVRAYINLRGERQNYAAKPIYIIRNMQAGILPFTVHDLAVRLSILEIDAKKGIFKIGLNTTQKDWVILEAVEKPLINILWVGTLVMCIGFGIAISRRYSEFMRMKQKGIE